MNNILTGAAIGRCAVVLTMVSAPAVAEKLTYEPIIIKEAPLHEKVADAKPSEVRIPEVITKAPVDPDFKKLDANSDGRISLKEAVKDRNLAFQFDATDANHDGMISADEYAGYKASLSAKSTDTATSVTN